MSALVLAALVVMWAVVLVPMFLKRSERNQELAGPARFAGAMRVLSRRRRGPALPADQLRAAVISAALGATPDRPVRPSTAGSAALRSATPAVSAPAHAPAPSPTPASSVSPARAARSGQRRAARVAARRRGLAVMGVVLLLSLLSATLVGGWTWIAQGAVDVFVLAGFAQLRASALADRAPVRLPRAPARAAAPMPETVAAQPVSTPAVRRDKQLIFDAVTGTPIVARPRVAPAVAAARATGRAAASSAAAPAGMPVDYYDAPAAPRRPERVYRPLLDAVDTDPDTLTDGIELLDGILGRASGQ